MEQHYLGRSGLKVSEVCLGAMTFGREADEATSRRMLDAFAERGGNFVDTADVYGAGTSEEVVGRWLAGQDRDQWVIATKVRFPSGPGVNEVGLSRKHVLASIDASLRRLQTDHVDLYQIHCWDRGTPLEETLTTLDTLVRQGKVRYVGASNLTGWQLQKAVDLSRQLGLEAFVSLQPQYNLLARPTEWELVPVCLAEGIGIIPWAPLRGGWLSGRYRRGMDGPPPVAASMWLVRRAGPRPGRRTPTSTPGASSTRWSRSRRHGELTRRRWRSGGSPSAPASLHRSSERRRSNSSTRTSARSAGRSPLTRWTGSPR